MTPTNRGQYQSHNKIKPLPAFFTFLISAVGIITTLHLGLALFEKPPHIVTYRTVLSRTFLFGLLIPGCFTFLIYRLQANSSDQQSAEIVVLSMIVAPFLSTMYSSPEVSILNYLTFVPFNVILIYYVLGPTATAIATTLHASKLLELSALVSGRQELLLQFSRFLYFLVPWLVLWKWPSANHHSDQMKIPSSLEEELLDLIVEYLSLELIVSDREGSPVLTRGTLIDFHTEPMVGYIGQALAGEQVESNLEIAENSYEMLYLPLHAKDGSVQGALCLASDVTEIQEAIESARQLAIHQERAHIAVEMHDAVTQTLYSARLMAETLPTLLEQDPERAFKQLWSLERATDGALAEMRSLLSEYFPEKIAQTPLGELIERYVAAAQSHIPTFLELNIVGEQPLLAPDIKRHLYRIFQEAINNLRHASAGKASIRIELSPDAVAYDISDNGIGFDVADKHTGGRLGLSSMHERARSIGAVLNIHSIPSKGTHISLVYHLDEGRSDKNERYDQSDDC